MFAPLAVLAVLLLAGCIGSGLDPTAAKIQASNDSGSAKNAKLEEETHYPNTSGMSFYRDAGDVINTYTKLFEPPKFEFSNTTTHDGKLIVYYFFSPTCPACKALQPEVDRLKAKYGNIEWVEYDITTENGAYAYQAFAVQHNLSSTQRLVPQILVNGTIITDRFNINKSIEGIISSFSTS